MRFSVIAFATLVASASASTLSSRQLPDCVVQCSAKAPQGDCNGDNSCLCNNKEFVAQSTECVQTTCPADIVDAAIEASRQLCLKVGVTLTSSFTPSSTATSPGGSTAGSASITPATTSATTSPSPSTPSNGAIRHSVNAAVGIAVIGLTAVFAL